MSVFELNSAKGVDTPGTVENKLVEGQEDLESALPSFMVTKYRAAAARCNFLGLDRPDVQFAAKEVSRGMANPTQGDVIRLKRLVRHLLKYPRVVFVYPHRVLPKNHLRV